jgi:hypothetical protein
MTFPVSNINFVNNSHYEASAHLSNEWFDVSVTQHQDTRTYSVVVEYQHSLHCAKCMSHSEVELAKYIRRSLPDPVKNWKMTIRIQWKGRYNTIEDGRYY